MGEGLACCCCTLHFLCVHLLFCLHLCCCYCPVIVFGRKGVVSFTNNFTEFLAFVDKILSLMMTRIEQVLPVHSVVHSTVQVLRFLCRCSVEGTGAVFTLQMLYLLDRCCLTAGVYREFYVT